MVKELNIFSRALDSSW
uniref:Uncharacterized protein n=1 Tax=Arundo donax TaxID=35708 RepID=A0A0A9CSH1_ARUDO